MLFRIVEGEVEIGNTAQLQALEDFVADETDSMLQRRDGAFLFVFRSAGPDEHPGMPTVRRQTHLVHDNGDFQTRILEFAGQHGIDFVGDLFADSFVTVVGCGPDVRICTGKSISTASRR